MRSCLGPTPCGQVKSGWTDRLTGNRVINEGEVARQVSSHATRPAAPASCLPPDTVYNDHCTADARSPGLAAAARCCSPSLAENIVLSSVFF